MEKRQRNIREVEKDRFLKSANERQKKKNLARQRIKHFISGLILIFAVIFILMMTPLFNIRNMGVTGNNIVSVSMIESRVSDLTGKNLFRVSKKDVKNRLSSLSYIKDVEISKKPFPPTLYIKITESVPVGYITIDAKQLVLDSDMIVIDDSNGFSVSNIPSVIGIDEVKYSVGKPLKITNTEKGTALKTILTVSSQLGVVNGIKEINLGNSLEITFNYEDRLFVNCGSSVDLDRKIRMFKEAVTNASIREDARGTINFIDSKLIFTPES